MEKYTLSATKRTITGRKVKTLRQQGFIPANLFGKTIKSESLQVSVVDFPKVYAQAGESSLVYLKVAGDQDEKPVLVREVVRDPVSELILHVDFNQVSLKEKITAPVGINVVGESPAEKEKLGILVQQLDEVEVEALPTDMPEHLDVDIAGLVAVDDAIYVKDLKVDAKITIKTDPEAIVVKIEKLAAEEKVEASVVAEGEATAPVAGEPVAEGSSDQVARPEPETV